ncbi:hypothetical protein PVAND_002484 [Polypedilum vanderplanki]|uniref:Lipase domain-containing protein n=1 Tax=Polypedilum vanderplanki TaxID=319348 RepID=A0A9J6BRC2_POLVA|nr:hypothetical protein PVAND_002484 [Polypedilum vanderplanki]
MKTFLIIFVIFQVFLSVNSVEYDKKFFLNILSRRGAGNVRFFLFTRRNVYAGQEIPLGDVLTLQRSNLNASFPVKFLIHGWRGDMDTEFNERATIEFLIKDNINVIRVDWSEGADTINYFTAANRVPEIGRQLGRFIDFLHINNFLDFNNVTIIGFSLGAQVAGHAGKNVARGKVNKIIGLDPAGPVFNSKDADGRLDYTDANYVEVIHTNMGFTGMNKLIGHTDFIANSGTHQPGCIDPSCSHHRATKFYIESINMNPFWARQCVNFTKAMRENCTGEFVRMGDPANPERNLRGIFSFQTNKSPPFSRVIPEI